jgi:hypothetical protein
VRTAACPNRLLAAALGVLFLCAPSAEAAAPPPLTYTWSLSRHESTVSLQVNVGYYGDGASGRLSVAFNIVDARNAYVRPFIVVGKRVRWWETDRFGNTQVRMLGVKPGGTLTLTARYSSPGKVCTGAAVAWLTRNPDVDTSSAQIPHRVCV